MAFENRANRKDRAITCHRPRPRAGAVGADHPVVRRALSRHHRAPRPLAGRNVAVRDRYRPDDIFDCAHAGASHRWHVSLLGSGDHASPRPSQACPIGSMPSRSPIRYFIVIVRSLFLRGSGWDFVWPQLWPMVLIATATLSVSHSAAGWIEPDGCELPVGLGARGEGCTQLRAWVYGSIFQRWVVHPPDGRAGAHSHRTCPIISATSSPNPIPTAGFKLISSPARSPTNLEEDVYGQAYSGT